MTQDLLPAPIIALMRPDAVTPGLLFLVSDEAPSRVILNATAGGFSRTLIEESEGIFLSEDERTPEAIAAQFAELSDMTISHAYTDGGAQVMKFVAMAAKAAGLQLS